MHACFFFGNKILETLKMERVENFLVCVKEALSQLCAEGTDVLPTYGQRDSTSFPLALCWICSEKNVRGVLV